MISVSSPPRTGLEGGREGLLVLRCVPPRQHDSFPPQGDARCPLCIPGRGSALYALQAQLLVCRVLRKHSALAPSGFRPSSRVCPRSLTYNPIILTQVAANKALLDSRTGGT